MDYSKYPIVEFKKVKGSLIPMQPWPQKFFISMRLNTSDLVEVRPLTFTSLIKSIIQNFISMSYWRFMIIFKRLGFLKTKEYEPLMWKDFTFKFWEK